SLFECAISRTYAISEVSALSLNMALACKTGCPLLARSLWAGLRQPRRQGFLGQVIEIPHSNRLSDTHPDHIGNVELFPHSMLLVQKAEYERPTPFGAGRFKPEHPVLKLQGGHDVFGDGS